VPLDLESKYTGAAARDYEARRIGSAKWEFERSSVEAMLPACETVLDVPVGTGRFLRLYQARGIAATGLDVSPDMLQLAGEKAPATLIRGDVLTHELGRQFDCVVCVRLANWMGRDFQPLLDRLAGLSRRWLLMSVTTTAGPSYVRHTGALILAEDAAFGAMGRAGLREVAKRSSKQKGGDMANIVLLEKA